MDTVWTKEKVKEQLKKTEAKGFIGIPEDLYRKDDGAIGQILEREFNVEENNLHIADLGTYELKGARVSKSKKKKTGMLTLFHKTSTSGLKPVEIFERYSYVKKSNRSAEMKNKLFFTARGNKKNKQGFILKASDTGEIKLYHEDDYLASWDLTEGKHKIKQVLLVYAETEGKPLSKDEKFHYIKAYILSKPKSIEEAIRNGHVAMDFCIDQPVDGSKAPHDRGPHIRINFDKLGELFGEIEEIDLLEGKQ